MAKPGDIYLGLSGSEILLCPFGRKFTDRIIERARAERVVSGTLKKDIVYRKKVFVLTYSTITGTAKREYEQLFDLRQELSFKWYDADNTENAHTVQMEPFDSKRLILSDDGLWEGMTIELMEV